MCEETLDFQCQHQHYGNIKYPIRESIFAVHLLYTVANADIGSLKVSVAETIVSCKTINIQTTSFSVPKITVVRQV